MSDIEKILYTSFSTILLFVIGQLISKFLLEPIQELKKTIGEVRFNLAYYAPTIHTPDSRNKERSDKAYDAIMKNSCDLLTKVDAIPFYGKIPCGWVLPIKNINQAAVDLRRLTTYLNETEEKACSNIKNVRELVKDIERNLQIRSLEE